MNDFDRLIEDSLRRRAAAVSAVPKGYGDVNRRIVRRRRRGATMATAAVTMPALAAVGWAASRPEPTSTPGIAVGAADAPLFTTTVPAAGTARFRCMIPAGTDGDWTYYEYCESVVAGIDGQAVADTFVPVTTLVPPTTVGYDMMTTAQNIAPCVPGTIPAVSTAPANDVATTIVEEPTTTLPPPTTLAAC